MTTRTAHGATTLPGECYTSEEVFGRELERIFARRWLCAGHLSELTDPGSYLVHQFGRESVLVVRDRDRGVRAFHNVCRHRGARLCGDEGGRFKSAIRCPYHAWTYALDGRLVAAPNMNEVDGFDPGHYPLGPVATATWEGFVFINLAAEPEPFESAWAPLLGRFSRWRIAELTPVHSQLYQVAANWKLFFQNYNECYHCPTVHPHLNRLTPYREAFNDLEEGPFLGGPMKMTLHGGSMTTSGARCAAPLGELSGDDLGLVYYYTLFPTMFLSLHPDYVLVHRALPDAADRTRIVCEWLFHPDAVARPDFDPRGAIEFWDLTNRQDWELCTLTQQGVGSRGYVPGPYAELESQLAAFDREYLRAMERSPD